jgi:hypothetical protein
MMLIEALYVDEKICLILSSRQPLPGGECCWKNWDPFECAAPDVDETPLPGESRASW